MVEVLEVPVDLKNYFDWPLQKGIHYKSSDNTSVN
jgi:hypothetical protein